MQESASWYPWMNMYQRHELLKFSKWIQSQLCLWPMFDTFHCICLIWSNSRSSILYWKKAASNKGSAQIANISSWDLWRTLCKDMALAVYDMSKVVHSSFAYVILHTILLLEQPHAKIGTDDSRLLSICSLVDSLLNGKMIISEQLRFVPDDDMGTQAAQLTVSWYRESFNPEAQNRSKSRRFLSWSSFLPDDHNGQLLNHTRWANQYSYLH